MKAPVPARVVVVEGKSAHGNRFAAELVGLSARVGRIRASGRVAVRENVKVDARGAELWGKLVASDEDAGTFDV
jgi:hypothetical protein